MDDLKERLERAMQELNQQERHLLQLYLREGMDDALLADLFAADREGILERLREIARKLREGLQKDG